LAIVYAILWREATSLPLLDDYHALFVFDLTQQHLSAAGRWLAIITTQHVDYKLVFEHALAAAQFALAGHIDLRPLVLLANLFLLPLGAIYWVQFRPAEPLERRLFLFLPIPWLLFQLTYAELLDWAQCSLQILPAITFSLLALYLLTRASRRSFGFACVAGLLAGLSSPNGFAAAPIGLLLLLQQRRLRRLIPWCLPFAVAFNPYLFDYVHLAHGVEPSLFIRFLYLLSLLGAAVENIHGFPVRHAAIALGLVLLLVYLDALRRRYYQANLFAVAAASWVILTAVMVAAVRPSLGLEQSLSSRYKIYCALMLVFCYQYFADRVLADKSRSRLARRRLYAAVLTVAVLFTVASDVVGLGLLKRRRAETVAGLAWYLAAPATHSPMVLPPGPGPENDATGNGMEARMAMSQALAAGVYVLPRNETREACARIACASGFAVDVGH
jgi:hypothetical protein